MPIYMDRHDLAGTTAEEVARAHLKDLAIQDRYGVKFLTYWFDEARGTAFCLVQSPDKETASRAHREAHGEQKRQLLRMEFKRFVNALILMPCQIVKGGHRLLYRLLSWNEWQGVFLRVVYALRC